MSKTSFNCLLTCRDTVRLKQNQQPFQQMLENKYLEGSGAFITINQQTELIHVGKHSFMDL